MPPSNFDKAESDRETIRDHLNFLESELQGNTTTPLTRTQAQNYLEETVEAKVQIIDNHKFMRSSVAKTVDMTPYVTDYNSLCRLASQLHSGFHGIVASFPPIINPTPTATSTPSSTHQGMKIPKIELPKFSGNLQEWISFRDMFITAIHNKPGMKNIEKLTQLKTLLTGKAARQVRSIILSDDNYDIAWQSLQDRYENKRELLFSILKRLITQPVISNGTAVSIRSLIDTTKECVRSLEVLAIPTQHWDAIIIYLLFSKLDASSRELWEQSLHDTSIPLLSTMYTFLEQRARALAAGNVQAPPRQQATNKPQQNGVRAHHVATSTCKFGCTTGHPYFKCQLFKSQTPQQRMETVKRLNLCLNCINEGHQSSSCQSSHTCKVCGRKHHTMLHLESGRNNQQVSQQQSPSRGASVSTHYINPKGQLTTGILATARVRIISPTGDSLRRSLLDPGSTNCHITERAAKQLNLNLKPCHIPMTGLSAASVGTAKYVTFTPHFNSMCSFSATALVVKSISTSIPSEKLRKEQWSHLKDLELADPDFDKPDDIDILLGTDVFWAILENEKIPGQTGQPFAVKSSLGWLVGGENVTSTPVNVFTVNADLDYHLCRFWEQETISEENKLSADERSCEEHFAATHKRDSGGRFIVSLPFKDKPQQSLGSSRQAAVKRFISLENKFVHHRSLKVKDLENTRKLTEQWKEYIKFMQEYESLGHMSPIPVDEIKSSSPTYYIPHHSVIKESSTTTKLRVVFDASAPTSTGISLNECMMVGPQLQDHITDIMLRFRLHPIAFTADIAKMYRQIQVDPKDTDFQRIVWREHPSQPLRDYRLLTVTYGTSSAPYLAVKCLQQLAVDEKERYPIAASIALRDYYVDDTASGCESLQDAKTAVTQLMDLCMSGGFELRKWTTNNQDLLDFIPEHLRETSSLVELQHDSTIKTLGVYWNPVEDKYLFRLSLPPDMPGSYTKRNILSDIAKIYDPLGWLAPAIIVCKVFMQELWKTKSGWDEILPTNIQDRWTSIKTSLLDLEKIEIPRLVKPASPSRITLIGCSDASTKAISAVIYLYCEFGTSSPTCFLISSKTRVAPVKHVTLPRLELNGAVLLSELMSKTVKALHLNFNAIRAYTDSTIALHWIKSDPGRWKIYIRRRVQTIQDNLPTTTWLHIRGDRNPADCASRGISADELLHHPLWWNGAMDIFSSTGEDGHQLLDEDLIHLEAETQIVKIHVGQPFLLHPIFTKYSSFLKLQRVIAYILRFLNNWTRKRRCTPLQQGVLTVTELLYSHNFILRQLQQSSFALEYETLSQGKKLPNNSSILNLQPFIAEDGIMRVGGRLRHALQPFGKRHPALLPKGHHITTSIIRDLHLRHPHAGPSATMAILQQRYWVVNARDTVRMVLRKCTTCARHRSTLMKQVMGDLPFDRVNPAPPFAKVGVDYAGPIAIRPMVRSRVSLKCWIAVFVCFATRAIHIEVVSSLSTDCFLAALRRFINRRGKPSDIYSDCGTNFKGTDKVLRDFLLLSQQQPIQEECSSQGVNWHFNPAGAPHFGGLWEAGVKSIKHHLKRVMGNSLLTYEEMHTLVVQIEGILNSRPIIPASADPSDLGALTPAHFLIGHPITSFPEPELSDVKENHLKRWQLLQRQQQLFWKRWSNEYLTRLQQRPKWFKPTPNLEIGHLVIVKDERLPPLKWRLGRVVAVHPGADGHVRVATLKTVDGEIKRPVVKLTHLPID